MARFTNVLRGRLLRRELTLIAYLRHSGWISLKTLARNEGVSERTVRRDLECLKDAGFPLISYRSEVGHTLFMIERGAPCPMCGVKRQAVKADPSPVGAGEGGR